ncbi:MAG: efflux transporter outer membrane subunit [Comamonadaceae bacterium]|nr:efflux transporter outer membrane subunit [Comamonadaceae bacterium]
MPKFFKTKGTGHVTRAVRGWQRLPACCALAVTLCACTSVPTHDGPTASFAVPAAWAGAEGLPVAGNLPLVDWWLRFDDVLLSRLIGQALAANSSIQSAQAALQQARALRDGTGASLWPTLGSSASVQRKRSDDHTGNSFQAGLDASWELDVFGGKRSALSASEASANASAASLGDVQVSIAAEVALNYLALRSLQERLAIAQANLASQQETLQLTDWRLQAGLVTSLEAEQARAAAEQTAAQIPTLQTSLAQTSHALSVLTGQLPAALSVLLAAPVPLPQAPETLALALPVDALRQRSDVRAAEFRVFAAAASVSQADVARLPSFRLGGSLGLSSLTLAALTDGASIAAGLLAGVSWPVFDGGASRAHLRTQQAAFEQANFAYQATVLTALTEVEDALVALRGDKERLRRLQNAFAAADVAATLASQRYSSGLVDFQTVLETQRTRLGTQDSVASARAAVSADHVRLYKALGGGWVPESSAAHPNSSIAPVWTPPT